jgi:toxin-antitoxin system PIN domain toxin
VPDDVWVAFVRLTTNRRIFTVPASLDDAFAYLRALRAHPNHVDVAPGPRHLEVLERLCREADAVGDLLPDAHLAALAIDHGAELVSFDRDVARFPGLRWLRPSVMG